MKASAILVCLILLGPEVIAAEPLNTTTRTVRIGHRVFGLLRADGWVGAQFWEEMSEVDSRGLALVCDGKTKKYGFMDTEGTMKVPLEWDDASPFAKGYARVGKDGKYGLLGSDGKLAFPLRWDDITGFLGDLCPVKQDGKWGYINLKGKLVIAPDWDEARAFPVAIDRARVRKGRFWGYIDHQGKLVIPADFDEARPFYCAITMVWRQSSGDWKCIDVNGKPVSAEEWKTSWDFPPDGAPLAVVQTNAGLWGVLKPDGTYAIKPVFEWLGDFHNGNAIAKKDGKLRIVTREGKDVVIGRMG